MNKAKDTSPLYRTNGSIDIAGAARSILAVTRTANKQNPAERYLVQVKSNLAPMGSAILFEVTDKGVNFLDELEFEPLAQRVVFGIQKQHTRLFKTGCAVLQSNCLIQTEPPDNRKGQRPVF